MIEPPAADAPAADAAAPRAFTIFVGALSYETDEQALRAYLAPCGEITRVFMPSGEHRANRGYAFVDFTTHEAVRRAQQLAEADALLDERVPRIRDDSLGRSPQDARAGTRIEPVRAVCRWEVVHHWEDVDMDTFEPGVPRLFRDYDIGLQVAPAASDAALPVAVQGVGVDEALPIDTFDQATDSTLLRHNLRLCGFTAPTPIQRYAVPLIRARLDIVACSQTGSGKTVAYTLPAIDRLLLAGPAGPSNRSATYPSVLVLAPTRELARQIETDFRKLAYGTFVHVAACYGGVPYEEEEQHLHGCHVVVATPGRLLDTLKRRVLSLSCVRTVVIDEADRMLDLGFEPDLRRIFLQADLPDRMHRQALMFSATFPANVQQIAHAFLRREFSRVTVGQVGMANLNIDQRVLWCPFSNKFGKLVELLDQTDDGMALVFVGRKTFVAELEQFLSEQGFKVTSLHGDKSQRERDQALEEFRSGQKTVLVATDVASRGLDIQNIAHVINFDLPSNIDDYVHRVGRTARAGRKGRATSLFCDDDTAIARPLANFFEQQGLIVPDWLLKAARERIIRDDNYAAWDRLTFDRAEWPERVYAGQTTVVGNDNAAASEMPW